MSAISSLWRRELLRFVRRPLAPAGTVALPLLMLVSGGPISAQSFASVGTFTLLLAIIPIADDSSAEFRQGIAASPARGMALILAKILTVGTVVLANSVLLAAFAAYEYVRH